MNWKEEKNHQSSGRSYNLLFLFRQLRDVEKTFHAHDSLEQVKMASSRFNIDSTTKKSKQNFLLVWVDTNVYSATADIKNTLEKLHAIVPDVQSVDRPDKAIDLLNNTDTETSFVIISGTFAQDLVPHIHPIRNLDAIYIFCQNVTFHTEWSKKWKKVIVVDNKIDPICRSLQHVVKQCNQDSIAMVLIDAGDVDNNNGPENNLNQLPPSFMYTTLLKDTLVKMKHDLNKEMAKFYANARDKYSPTIINQSDLERFRRDYQPDQAVQWYTKQTFIFPLMNDGLRYSQGDVIVDMGFFIHDLHHQLVELQQQQSKEFGNKTFIIYRGQALPKEDLQQLQKKRGGLFGFKNFLSSSLKQDRSLKFAQRGPSRPDCVGVLFKMMIDPKLTRTPFADIHYISDFPDEAEVLVGMHAVFRIGNIQPIGCGHTLIYEIELELTADDDPQLRRLTEHMGENILADWDWHRIGWILQDMNQLDKAEEVYLDLLKENLDVRKKGIYNGQLGQIYFNHATYEEALDYYQKSLQFYEQVLPEDDLELATSYNSIGGVYEKMGEYAKALSYCEKSLAIMKKKLPDTHPNLAALYSNMGRAYNGLREYSKAIMLHNLTLNMISEILPSGHPNFASLYRNFAFVYRNMQDYQQALEYFQKAEDICKKAMPTTHPELAILKEWIEEMQAKI